MLPQDYSKSYKLYKSDTSIFLKWLEETSIAHGAAPIEHGSTGIYRMPACLITELAQHVASQNPPVQIPAKIAARLRYVVQERRRLSKWFQSRNVQLASNERHQFFIEVLEKVMAILNIPPRIVTSKAIRKQDNTEAAPSQTQRPNKFGALADDQDDVLELEAELEDLSIEEFQPVEDSEEAVTFDIDDGTDPKVQEFNDAAHASAVVLQEVDAIREFVLSSWLEHKTGTLDLSSAAAITDLAIARVRDVEAQFHEDHPVARWFFLEKRAKWNQRSCHPGLVFNNYVHSQEKRTEPQSRQEIDCHDAFTYQHLHVNLDAWYQHIYLKDLEAGYIRPPLHNKLLDIAQSSLTATSKKYQGVLIARRYVEMAVGYKEYCGKWLPASDRLLQGIWNYIETGDLTLATSFAMTINVELHHLFGKDGLSELFEKRVKSSFLLVQNRLKNAKPVWVNFAQECTPDASKTMVGFNNLESGGRFFEGEDPYATFIGPENPMQAFDIFRLNPMLGGLLVMLLRQDVKNLGEMITNRQRCAISMAYIYKYARRRGLSLRWPDLDNFMDVHAASNLFGNDPATAREVLVQHHLMNGVSLQSITIKAARRSAKLKTNAPRPLKSATPMTDLWREHRDSRPGHYVNLAQELVKAQILAGIHLPKGDPGSLPSALLLQFVKHLFAREDPILIFDYFSLHSCALATQKLVLTELEDVMDRVSAQLRAKTKAKPLDVSFNILIAVQNAEIALDHDKKGLKPGQKSVSKILLRTAQAMDKILEKQGNKACRLIKAFAVNKEVIVEREPWIQRDMVKELDADCLIFD